MPQRGMRGSPQAHTGMARLFQEEVRGHGCPGDHTGFLVLLEDQVWEEVQGKVLVLREG